MAGETTLTIVGNATADAELRFTPSGKAVANFTVASTPRRYNSQTNSWEDQEALFMRCAAWGQMGENVAETVTRGARVVVVGRLKQRSYETSENQKRTVIELEVDEVGPSLKFVSATINRPVRNEGGQQRQAPAEDPWGSAPPRSTANDTFSDEPPF